MDESFATLDHFTRENMQQALLDIHRSSRCGVLFVTHSNDKILAIGEHIVILDGKHMKKVYPLDGIWCASGSEEQQQAPKADILSSIS